MAMSTASMSKPLPATIEVAEHEANAVAGVLSGAGEHGLGVVDAEGLARAKRAVSFVIQPANGK